MYNITAIGEDRATLGSDQISSIVAYNMGGILSGTEYLNRYGGNAYPSQFDAFLAAVQKLLGGREFQ